ncbi:hypothetical protein BsWGS_19071 [Bradybaena similaris]
MACVYQNRLVSRLLPGPAPNYHLHRICVAKSILPLSKFRQQQGVCSCYWNFISIESILGNHSTYQHLPQHSHCVPPTSTVVGLIVHGAKDVSHLGTSLESMQLRLWIFIITK